MRLPASIVIPIPRLSACDARFRGGLTVMLVAAMFGVVLSRGEAPTAAGARITGTSFIAWGDNTLGQLGTGNTNPTTSPVLVGSQTGFTTVATGGFIGFHSLGVVADGRVFAAGWNSSGQLGNGTNTDSSSPVQVTINSVVTVAAGNQHSVAVKNDGTVWAWGRNHVGQLGNTPSGTPADSNVPVQVLVGPGTPLTGVTAVAAGQQHTVALRNDGTVWAWGYNNDGELGDTTTTQRNVAVQVRLATPGNPTLAGAVAVAAGSLHSLAVVGGTGGPSTNTAVAWGFNSSGELGNGSTTPSTNPAAVQVNTAAFGGAGLVKVAGGLGFSLGVTNDGQVWAWGQNGNGELGTNATGAGSSVPVKVHGPGDVGFLGGVASVAAGSGHALALKSDGGVMAWGMNSHGQLGDGTTIQRLVPVAVPTVNSVGAVAAGQGFSLAAGTLAGGPSATATATATATTGQPPPQLAGNLYIVSAIRVLETRATDPPGILHAGFKPDGSAVPVGPLAPGTVYRYKIAGQTFNGIPIPAAVKGVVVNVTALPTAGTGGYLSIFQGDVPDASKPLNSVLNPINPINYNGYMTPLAPAGATIGGQPVGGTIAVYSSSVPVDLVMDLTGFYQ